MMSGLLSMSALFAFLLGMLAAWAWAKAKPGTSGS
jgi:hypothetical protein